MKHYVMIAIAIASLAGCGGSGSNSQTTPINPPPSALNPTSSAINSNVKRLSYDVAQASRDGFVDVDFENNDVSILLNVSTEDASKGIVLTEIRDPSDRVIYSATVDPSTGDTTSLTSEFTDEVYANRGDLSVFLPPTPDLSIETGTYRFVFERQDDASLRRTDVFIKSITANENIDMQAYSLDLNIFVAHPDTTFTSSAFKQRVQVDYKDSINRILVPHSLRINDIEFLDASSTEITRFSSLDIENDLGAACQAMLAVTENKLAVNLVYVRELTSSEGDPAGVSPGVGVILDQDANNACVFVAEQAYVADPSSGFTQDLADQMMAGNMLHEIGHFMSLEHPTESKGTNFDPIADTPECDAATFDGRDDTLFGIPGELDGEVSDFECGIEGGAKNFIFYSGVPQFLPFEMSAQQAQVLRRHPLFVRVQ